MQYLNTDGVKSLWAKIKGAFLSINGGTLNGDLNLKQNKIWVKGGSDAGGNVNRMTTTSGMPTDMKYNNGKRGTQIYSNGIAFCDPYNGNANNDSGWIRHLEETTNQGLLEIAVGDDAQNEEIHFRYYNINNAVAYDINVPRASGTIALTRQIPTKVSQLTNDSGYLKDKDSPHFNNVVASYFTCGNLTILPSTIQRNDEENNDEEDDFIQYSNADGDDYIRLFRNARGQTYQGGQLNLKCFDEDGGIGHTLELCSLGMRIDGLNILAFNQGVRKAILDNLTLRYNHKDYTFNTKKAIELGLLS